MGPLSYRVKVNDQIWKRHVDQLLTRTCTADVTQDDNAFDGIELTDAVAESTNPESESTTTEIAISTPRYSTRERHPPDRFNV